MPVEIRELTLDRVDEAVDVATSILGPVPGCEQVAERLRSGQGLFYVAVDTRTGRIVGIKFGFIGGHMCIGRGIAVLPEYRRQGIATRLVRRFEEGMSAVPGLTTYVFGSDRTEGIPFHIAVGYCPRALIQFSDRSLRPALDLTGFQISHEGYNEQYHVYQVYVDLEDTQRNLEYLWRLQQELPQTSVQFVFSRIVEPCPTTPVD